MHPAKPRSAPLPPRMQGIAQAVSESEPLTQLARRLQASNERLRAISPLLPPAMRSHVQAGPIDDESWVMLAANQAVSAKLRQMLPALQARLQELGWAGPPIIVRLAPRG